MEVAAPFLNIPGEGIPSQYSFKFSDFSKCFIFSFIARATPKEDAGRCREPVRPTASRARARGAIAERSGIPRHRGKKPGNAGVFDFARKVARHYTNVLLVGATGTGKELVARAIHQLSPVSQQKLAVCNCSAMVDTLLESQLFAYMRGAFTGATDTRPGLFEYANGGTVFLDEVGEMSLAMQAKLLRVIQNREIQRVGSPEVRQVNVRLIAATNRDLRAEVLAGVSGRIFFTV
jgi:DNA-binding NtrC family response regulator